MEIDEFKVLVKGLKAVYTSDNFLPTNDAIKIWYSMLKDISYDVMSMAIQKYMMSEKFPPTIADLRQYATEITQGEVKSWDEAFAEARQSISNFGYMREKEALESLSPMTREVVKRMGYQDMCMCEDIEVERGQFRRAYENLVSREQQRAQISPAVRELIEKTQKQMIGAKG